MIPGSANPLLLASAASAAGYNIERSLRFNSADSAYLSRTPLVAGNRNTWTWAGWVKRSKDATGVLFGSSTGTVDALDFSVSNLRLYFNNTSSGYLVTSQVFRDFSAWYHIVLAIDTTQATSSNRARIYVNGTEITAFSTTVYPTLNYDSSINNNVATGIGARGAGIQPFSGYLADVHFIDGQALGPTSFGEFDANGVWQPKAYTGTYPGNSFHLDFADNSTATTAGIGKDVSGNGNDWTPVNLSVAAGASNDSIVDTPTPYGTDTGAGGEVRGNYCTLNPLAAGAANLSNGNLDASLSTGSASSAFGTVSVTSGKWYWEVTPTSSPTGGYIGIMDSTFTAANSTSWSTQARSYQPSGNKYDGTSSAYGASYTTNDVVGIALDLDSNSLTFYKNGVSQGAAFTSGLVGKEWKPHAYGAGAAISYVCNFGQRPFAFPVSGFKALCTTNLPEPQTITTSGSYTGNGVADGPVVYLNGVPTAMTVNGNAVTFGTEADKLSSGFKVRTTSTAYNQNAATYNYSITSTGDPFKVARAQSNP